MFKNGFIDKTCSLHFTIYIIMLNFILLYMGGKKNP